MFAHILRIFPKQTRLWIALEWSVVFDFGYKEMCFSEWMSSWRISPKGFERDYEKICCWDYNTTLPCQSSRAVTSHSKRDSFIYSDA